MSATTRRHHLAALIRTLRENGRLLAVLTSRCETDRLTPPTHGGSFKTPSDIAAYLGPEMANLPQEQLRVVLLDRRGRLIDAPLIYQGGQTETAVRLADCFREAVRRSAAAIVLVHNHPAGDAAASPDDVQVTYDAGQAGLLLGIPVLDHVILARDGVLSLRAEGLYDPPRLGTSLELPADIARTPVQLEVPRRFGDGVLGWGYDCARCGARVRGLEAGRISCQRCLAGVICRVIDTTRELHTPEFAKPAAA